MIYPGNKPAFPHRLDEGMTLRDYLAGQVLAGLCANPSGPFQANLRNGWALVNCTTTDVAAVAYDLADAMLEVKAS